MQRVGRLGTSVAFGLALTGLATTGNAAHAAKLIRTGHHPASSSHSLLASASGDAVVRHQHGGSKHVFGKGSKVRYASVTRGTSYGGGLQCVPFARAASGIELKGNAANWWDAAAGVYDRGNSPESGSVLNFRANGHMRLGHVAVVTALADSRHIEIEHANWAGPGSNKSGVSHNIPVEDVSPNNDWTEVRVGLGRSGDYGSTYATYGFIYDRPDTGTRYAAGRRNETPAAQTVSYDEVAQAPAAPHRISGIFDDAPTHNVR